MGYFKGDIKTDELCRIIIEALRRGPQRSSELFPTCKDKYAKSWGKSYSFGVIVSDSEIRYRLRRLLKDGLIRRHQREYSLE
jgi:DNA-binding Lrp family transcriptional regulator